MKRKIKKIAILTGGGDVPDTPELKMALQFLFHKVATSDFTSMCRKS